ncbi:hypothetical protein ACFQVA_36420 [Actinomadura keratinilytica]
MLTVVIIVAAVIVVAVAAYALMRRENTGPALKKRFGPEYDRTLARHNGDTAAARQELGERLKRHGSLKERPLSAESLARYEAEWAGVQRRFVDSPQQAMADAGALLARLAQERGYPGPEQGDEQIAALSVHHAHQVEGYRTVRKAAEHGGDTERMRESLLSARSLYEALTGSAGHPEAAARPTTRSWATTRAPLAPTTTSRPRPGPRARRPTPVPRRGSDGHGGRERQVGREAHRRHPGEGDSRGELPAPRDPYRPARGGRRRARRGRRTAPRPGRRAAPAAGHRAAGLPGCAGRRRHGRGAGHREAAAAGREEHRGPGRRADGDGAPVPGRRLHPGRADVRRRGGRPLVGAQGGRERLRGPAPGGGRRGRRGLRGAGRTGHRGPGRAAAGAALGLGGAAGEPDTERLRVALQSYREASERLLKL